MHHRINLVVSGVVRSSIVSNDLFGVQTSRYHVVGLEPVVEGGDESVERMTDEQKLEVVLQSVVDLLRRVASLIHAVQHADIPPHKYARTHAPVR